MLIEIVHELADVDRRLTVWLEIDIFAYLTWLEKAVPLVSSTACRKHAVGLTKNILHTFSLLDKVPIWALDDAD